MLGLGIGETVAVRRMMQGFLAAGCLVWVSPLSAALPAVRFDAPTVVECRDVTPEAFAEAHPDQKIIEATFSISALVTAGREEDVTEMFVIIASPERRLKVFDYAPRTELASEMAGPIETITTRDKTKSAQAGLGGDLASLCNPLTAHLTPSAGLAATKHDGVTEKVHKLPPLSAVVTSGTTHAGHGTFFKLRQSSQVSLEGAREYTCRFVVPTAWRGDWLAVRCRATGRERNLFGTHEETCGSAQLLVGLYLQGDADAWQVAEQLGQAPAKESGSGRQASSGVSLQHPETWFSPSRPAPDPRAAQRQALAALSGHKGY